MSAGSDLDTGAAQFATFLPDDLVVDGTLEAHGLKRGLFTVPAYRAVVRLRASFNALDPAAAGFGVADLEWDRAALVVEVSDPSTIGTESGLEWRGEAVGLLPGAMGGQIARPGLHGPVAVAPGTSSEFLLELELSGSTALRFVPFAKNTRVSLTSDWPDPSFAGAWLPVERKVESGGFRAEWRIPFLGRDYAQQWTNATDPHELILESRFGVDLVTPIGGATSLVAVYAKAVLRSTARGVVMGGAMGRLYSYLLALLTLERYALLAGSVGLFVALAVVMYLTRWVDWERFGPRAAET